MSDSNPAPRLSIVVPTFNERENVAPLAERIFRAVDPGSSELLFIDDASPDDTAAAVRRLTDQLPVRCLVRTNERGLATAVIRGLSEARGDICVVIDADLSHPPEVIPRLVAALDDPAVEMAIGSRFVPGASVDLRWPLHRRFVSRIGRLLARPLTRARDMVAGFFAVRRAALDLTALDPVGYKIALELIVRHRWRHIVEVPITFCDRGAGKTKLTAAEQFRYLRHLARLYAFVLSGRAKRR